VAATQRTLTGLRQGLALPQVRTARDDVLAELDALQVQLAQLSTASRLVPELLGTHGTRHILVVLQQPAESRATGGIDAGVILVSTKDGRATIQEVTSKVPDSATPVIGVSSQYAARYDARATLTHNLTSNLSPDFSVVGSIWAGLWATRNAPVDAVVGVTPKVLDLILQATGPVTLPDGTHLAAGDATRITTKTLYDTYPLASDEPRRQAYQNALLGSVVKRLLGEGTPLRSLIAPLGRAVASGDLRVWAAKPDLEAALRTLDIGGALPVTAGPFLGVITQDFGGSKLDTYLQREISYSRRQSGASDLVRVGVDLTNTAPAHGLPPYVTYRGDLTDPQAHPGQTRVWLSVYLATDAKDPTLTVGGRRVADPTIDHEGDHLIVSAILTIDPGATSEAVVTATEPHSDQPPVVLRQPTLLPDRLRIS
jgi:hypothetical protein